MSCVCCRSSVLRPREDIAASVDGSLARKSGLLTQRNVGILEGGGGASLLTFSGTEHTLSAVWGAGPRKPPSLLAPAKH